MATKCQIGKGEHKHIVGSSKEQRIYRWNIWNSFFTCSAILDLFFSEGNIDAFRFKLVETHSQPLSRLCSESVHIHTSEAQIPMNSKAEWHAPVVPRVVVTRELEELEQQGGAGRGRGRGRGRPAGGGRGRRQRGGA